ncbi:hypothetical protein RCL06_24585, partial [Salmonella enterica subsp. enterica serovar Typhimurium]
ASLSGHRRLAYATVPPSEGAHRRVAHCCTGVRPNAARRTLVRADGRWRHGPVEGHHVAEKRCEDGGDRRWWHRLAVRLSPHALGT